MAAFWLPVCVLVIWSVQKTNAIYTDQEVTGSNVFQTGTWGDTTPPTTTTLDTVNNGSSDGKAEVNDQIILVFDEPINPGSIKSGWSGVPTSLSITLEDNAAAYASKDIVTFDVNLGVITLGHNKYTNGGDSIFGAVMVWDEPSLTLTVTLSSLDQDNVSRGKKRTATYYPDALIEDTAGNPVNTSVTPTINDKHF